MALRWLFLRGTVQGLVPHPAGKRFSPNPVRSGRQTVLGKYQTFPPPKKIKYNPQRSLLDGGKPRFVFPAESNRSCAG